MSPVGIQALRVGGQTSKAPFEISYSLDLDMHAQQVTLLLTSTEGLSIPPTLLFTKDQC